MSRIRVLIVDDHAVLRAGLRMLMGGQPDMEVVGEAADGEEAVRQIPDTRPDVVLMDITMPGIGGIKAIEKIRRARPETRIPSSGVDARRGLPDRSPCAFIALLRSTQGGSTNASLEPAHRSLCDRARCLRFACDCERRRRPLVVARR